MRKDKHRPEDETSLPEELLMKALFFIFCFSSPSLPPSLISLEVFYEDELQIQLKTRSWSVLLSIQYNLCIVTILFSIESVEHCFYKERRLFIEKIGQYVWFVWLCLSHKFVVYFWWWWWRLWLKSTTKNDIHEYNFNDFKTTIITVIIFLIKINNNN